MLSKNDFNTIVNKKLDRALVQGQFTDQIKSSLIEELDEKGFKKEYMEIKITPNESDDGSDTTYAPRGEEVVIQAIYKKPHIFYFVNKFMNKNMDEKNFYISTKISGMSEIW